MNPHYLVSIVIIIINKINKTTPAFFLYWLFEIFCFINRAVNRVMAIEKVKCSRSYRCSIVYGQPHTERANLLKADLGTFIMTN